MKIFIIIAVVVLGLGGLFYLSDKGSKQDANSPQITMQAIQADVANGAQFIDIRTAEEFASGHIEGAKNVTLQDIRDGKMPASDKTKTVYVYCQTGSRSKQAAFVLKNLGYQNIVDLGAIAHVESIGGVIKS